MKYCPRCGKQVEDEAKFCPNCGQALDDMTEPRNEYMTSRPQQTTHESSAIGILAIIFSICGGLLGLIFSIIGLNTYKEPSNRKLCKIGLGLCLAWVAMYIIGIMVERFS